MNSLIVSNIISIFIFGYCMPCLSIILFMGIICNWFTLLSYQLFQLKISGTIVDFKWSVKVVVHQHVFLRFCMFHLSKSACSSGTHINLTFQVLLLWWVYTNSYHSLFLFILLLNFLYQKYGQGGIIYLPVEHPLFLCCLLGVGLHILS